jgi:hypothetical protein
MLLSMCESRLTNASYGLLETCSCSLVLERHLLFLTKAQAVITREGAAKSCIAASSVDHKNGLNRVACNRDALRDILTHYFDSRDDSSSHSSLPYHTVPVSQALGVSVPETEPVLRLRVRARSNQSVTMSSITSYYVVLSLCQGCYIQIHPYTYAHPIPYRPLCFHGIKERLSVFHSHCELSVQECVCSFKQSSKE